MVDAFHAGDGWRQSTIFEGAYRAAYAPRYKILEMLAELPQPMANKLADDIDTMLVDAVMNAAGQAEAFRYINACPERDSREAIEGALKKAAERTKTFPGSLSEIVEQGTQLEEIAHYQRKIRKIENKIHPN